MVELANKQSHMTLSRTFESEEQSLWDLKLPQVFAAMNAGDIQALGHSRSDILFGMHRGRALKPEIPDRSSGKRKFEAGR